MKRKRSNIRSTTYKFQGGYLHIDHVLVPIVVPAHLGAVQPLVPSGQDEKMPIAGRRNPSKT